MRTLARNFSFTAILSSCLLLNGFSQEAATSAAPVVRTETEGAASTVVKDTKKEGADPTALDYLFNKRPQEGTAGQTGSDITAKLADKIKALDSLNATPGFDNKVMRSRFEKFLGTPEVSKEVIAKYQADYDNVLKLLREKRVFEAWKRLFVLGDYQELDSGLSGELANRVESVWNADTTMAGIKRDNEKLREAIDTSNRSADMMSQGTALSKPAPKITLPKSVPTKAESDDASKSVGVEGKLRMAEEYLRSLESKAQIKINEVRKENLSSKSKSDFADYISTLFAAKRHYHVILAADFYRRIFDEGEYPVTMANQVNASLEAISDVRSSIEVFRYKVSKNEIAGAAERLQDAFIAGEVHLSMRGLDRNDKQKVSTFATKLSQMQNLIEARDFGRLDEVLSSMKKIADDFDPAKPRALVDAVKLESKMRLGKAKLAAQQGNLAAAMEEFRSAAEAWPANPQLESAAGLFFDSQDVKNQSTVDFDRLVQEQNYRKIFENQLPFLAAVKGDKKREDQLKTALEKVKEAEVAAEKANLLLLNGDFQGAWETADLALRSWPDDPKLNKLRSSLTTKSAEFVSALTKAQEAETRKEYGYSLSWYVNAQRYYPASQIAIEAIDRLTKQIFNSSDLSSGPR